MTGPESPPTASVKKALKQILEGGDMNTLTERRIFEQLQGQLGPSVRAEHRALVKAGIEHFLDGGSLEDGAEGGEAPGPSSGEGRGGKRKLDFMAEAGGPAKLQKREDGSWAAPLSATRQVVVRSFKGRPLVDVREFYSDKASGEAKPGKRGLALDAAQWALLTGGAAGVSGAVREGRAHTLALGAEKRCTVAEYSGQWGVDLRLFYEKDGEQLPGAKGIRLPEGEWQALVEASAGVTRALEELGGGKTSPSGGQPAAASTSTQEAKTPAEGTSQPAAPDAAGSAPGPGGSSSAPGGLPIELSNNRRADVSEFKGKRLVNVREYYTAGGEQKPAKKGLSLTPEQFAALKEHANAISAAAAAKDTSLAVKLSDKRRARINIFKHATQVDLREIYEKDGQELPGKKGIALTVEQWETLRRGFGALEEALAAGAK